MRLSVAQVVVLAEARGGLGGEGVEKVVVDQHGVGTGSRRGAVVFRLRRKVRSHRNHGNHRKFSLRLMVFGWPVARNLREHFRIVFAVSALFSQFRIRRGRAGVKRQIQIFLLAYARSDSGRGLRGMFTEAQGCLLIQRRHLAPCRKRDTIPARQRYNFF